MIASNICVFRVADSVETACRRHVCSASPVSAIPGWYRNGAGPARSGSSAVSAPMGRYRSLDPIRGSSAVLRDSAGPAEGHASTRRKPVRSPTRRRHFRNATGASTSWHYSTVVDDVGCPDELENVCITSDNSATIEGFLDTYGIPRTRTLTITAQFRHPPNVVRNELSCPSSVRQTTENDHGGAQATIGRYPDLSWDSAETPVVARPSFRFHTA